MSDTPAVHCISELHDLILLQVPEERLAHITTELESSAPRVRLAWPLLKEKQLPARVERLIDSLTLRYPTVAISPPIMHSDNTRNFLTVQAADVEDALPEEAAEGEPIPSDSSFPISFTVGDVAFDIASYDGMTYTLLHNGAELEGDYPNMAAAVGALLPYVLREIADQEAQKGTPNPQQSVDKEFLFELSQYFRKSPIVPDDSIQKHLVDFVELTTHRDFDA